MPHSQIMNFLTHLGLADLVIALIVVASILGALRRRAGLIAALASGVGTALVLWLVAGALLAWGPSSIASVTQSSALLQLVPPPVHALQQLGDLVGQGIARLDRPA